MAVWLVARALGAVVPRRLVYVVDRRAVVDQATEVAESLRMWVEKERAITDSLGLGDRSLPISTLRGQHVDNREWLEDPSSPAIVIGTIDMVGSRLLFSGYGVSSKMRPYHAGLLGSDTLVVLDEAHLVPAFEDLLRQVEHGTELFGPKEPSRRALLPRFKMLSLSATGRQTGSAPLTLTDADRRNPIVSKRLSAKKALITVELAAVAEATDANEDERRNDRVEEDETKKSKGPNLASLLANQAWVIEHAAAVSETKGEEAQVAAKQVVAIALTPRGEVKGWWTLEQLAAAKSKGKQESKEAKKAREYRTKQLEDLLIGATLVVDARIGGLIDGLLDDKTKSVADAADDDSTTWLVRADAADVSVTGFRVRQLRAGQRDNADSGWSAAPGAGWVRRYRFVTEMADGEPSAALVIDGWVGDAATEDERAEADRPQQLDEHQSWAEECARAIAKRLGLDEEHEDLLALAARLHDEGKRALRWQRAFKAPVDGRPYAKTRGPIDFDILDGYRHELGSLPYVENHEKFLKLSPDEQELVLHVIAAHHGYARPVIGTSGCDDPPSIVEERARVVALRFARLSRRWGPWGLAWWEALLRAADQAASRRNQQGVAASAPKEQA